MKMTASFLALACAATLPLASVAHAATPESATTVSAAQSQTILEVSASGKLSEIGAAGLGPDVRLTVRLHGPIAFDVDTANFASLEIYGDDAAATLTVSEPMAYDRLTAVSFPKANGSSVNTFTSAVAASAGVATLAEGDTAGDGGTIPNHLSVNVKGNVSEISGTSSASGLAPWRFNDSEWVNTTGDRGSTITVSGATFEVTSVGGGWSLGYSGGMDRIASQISRLGAMGNGYRDGVWTVGASNIPYGEYSLILYLATDNSGKTWSRTKLTQNGSDSYYYYADENGQRALKSDGNDGTTWGSTTDIATDGKAAHVGRDIMVIPGLSGDSFTFNLSGTSGNDTERGGLFGFQVVKSRDIVIGDNVTDAQLSNFDVVDGKDGYLTDAFVTATIGAGSTLTIDTNAFYHLTLKGPTTSEAPATLKIAVEVDFSKIDFSEATNVTIELVSGCTAVPGGEWATGDVRISTPVTLTVDSVATAPYWSVGGTLTIADGGSLTVAVAKGVKVPNPYKVIQASSVPDSGIQSAGETYKVSKVDNAYWLLGSGGLRAEVPAGTNNVVLWSDLPWRDSVTGDDILNPVFATNSTVTLVFSETSARTVQFDGARATEEGAEGNVTIDTLTVRTPIGVNPVISYGSDANNNRFWVNGRVTLVGEGATLDRPDTYPTVTMPIRAHAAIDGTQTRGELQLDKANLVLGTDAGLAEVPSGQTDSQFNGTWYRKNAISGNGSIRYDGIGTIFLNANFNPSIYEEGVTFEVTNGTLQFQNAGRHYIDSNIIVGGGKTDATPTLALVEWNNSLQLGLESELLFKDGAKFLIKNGNNADGGGRVTGGQIIIEAKNKPVTFAGSTWGNSTNVSSPISGSGTLKFERDGGNPWTVSGKITDGSNGSLALRIACDIVSVTNTNNDFTGGVEIDVATKSFSPEVLGTGSIVVNTEGVLNLSSSLTVVKNQIIGGSGQIAGGVAFQDGSILDVTNGVLSIDALQMPTEAEGKVTVRVTENADAGAAVLNVTGADATKAKKFTTDVVNTYVTASDTGFVLGRMTTADTDGHNPALGSKLAGILADAQAAAIENGITSVNLVYGQCGGKTLTAAQAEAGAELFNNVVTTTTEGATTTVTVAYDFGITGLTLDEEGTLIVKAKVQGPTEGVAFIDGTHVNLYRVDADGSEVAIATIPASSTTGEVTLEVQGALTNMSLGTTQLKVKASTEAATVEGSDEGGIPGMDPLPGEPGKF